MKSVMIKSPRALHADGTKGKGGKYPSVEACSIEPLMGGEKKASAIKG